jgi:iron complex outermembrane receptor protein
MRTAKILLLCCASTLAAPAFGEDDAPEADRETIIVTADALPSGAATKTDVPALEVPQPITVVTADVYEAQGAVSISDTLRYVAGVTANPYGPDSRIDGGFVRGLDALQFRDGMRDIFSYYASIRSDPYNFSEVQLVRGPASVLFGAGSLGGLINMVSKRPEFTTAGELSLRYGSYDRKEALADVTGPIGGNLAGRVVARWRDSGSQTDYVPDDRVLFSPSLAWAPTMDTTVTLIGLYQEDDGGSTSQFLPLVGTILPNPNGKLPNDLFIGKPGWDRYDGRLAQGTALVDHRFSDRVKLSLKARYIDSDLTYLTHYPDNYTTPDNPFTDPDQRIIGLYADGSLARMEIFTTDNNMQFNFNTGGDIEHVLLAGVDYSWNRVRKEGGYGYEFIDIYDIDYDALSDYGGGVPTDFAYTEDTRGKQLGLYVQDQVRFWDKVSVVVGARHDNASASSSGVETYDTSAWSFRAGIIADLLPGVSPFFSYTESFEPIAGTASNGDPFVPQNGRQFEAGVKIHPGDNVLVTLTAYHIKQTNRPVDDPSTPDPFDQMQAGSLTSKGFEAEASASLPGNFQLLGNISYNKAEVEGTGVQLDNVPKFNASLWATKTIDLGNEMSLMLGGGINHTGSNRSYGFAFPDGILTPSYTLVDALARLDWRQWRFQLNATNLLGEEFYSACLARGDCFMGAERNVYGTVSYRF